MVYNMIPSMECSKFHPISTSGLLYNGMQSLPRVSIKMTRSISLTQIFHCDMMTLFLSKDMFQTLHVFHYKHSNAHCEKHLLLFAIKAHQ